MSKSSSEVLGSELLFGEDPLEEDLKDLSQMNRADPNHGLQGTEKQQRIIALAGVTACEFEVEKIARWVDSSDMYVGSVLRRADKSLWTEIILPVEKFRENYDGQNENKAYYDKLVKQCEQITDL